jgi:hypothetical protein
MKLATSLFVCIAALAARITVFANGGAGAWLCVIAFWAAFVVLIVISTRRLRRAPKDERMQFIFIIVGLLAFGYRAIVPSGPSAELSTVLVLICLVGMVITYIRTTLSHRHRRAVSS